MTAKEYLQSVQKKRRQMLSLMYRVEELHEQAEGVRAIVYDKDRIQTSPENKMEKLLAEILPELEDKYAKAIERYHVAFQKAEAQIAGMEKPDHAEILRLRYLEVNEDGRQYSLEEVAVMMHKSYYRTKHLHGEALESFRRKYMKK